MAASVPEVEIGTVTRTMPRWHVVLLNDEEHTYEYVVEMLGKLFAKTPQQAFAHACEVDATGRSIVDTTSRERGELKVQQIHAYGPDPRMAGSRGPMGAELEPAE